MTESRDTPLGVQLAVGTLLAERYKILRRLGGGAMGSVYLAEDQNLANRLVAVKEIIETFADEGARAKAIEDFKREAELLARLDHPAIPTIYQYFLDTGRGRYYLVMKYIDGGDLARRFEEVGGKVDELTVTQWAIEICDVLEYIHSQSPPIIYRDLKPANLMLDSRNRVMLVDFGISRFIAPTQKGVTAIGTMGYAPPELFAGKVEPASDIYSLGATMFHLLTGNDPQDKPLMIFDFTRNPKPRQLNPDITPEMEQMICRAVEDRPADRFPTASAFHHELKKHVRRLMANQPADPSSISIDIPIASLTRQCVHCVHEMAIDDVFCAFCGQKQTTSRGTAKLVILGTTEMIAQFLLNEEGENLIGRMDPNHGIRPEVDLSRYDPAERVSRRHAKIVGFRSRFFIEDLGSANGTFLNGQIASQGKQHALVSGDEVRLGETTLKFIETGPTALQPKPIYLDDNVQFSVYQPKAIRSEQWYPFLVFAHLSERRALAPMGEADPIEEMRRQAELILGDQISSYHVAMQDSNQAVPLEGGLTFVPSVPNIEFNPPSRTFVWQESVHREEFRIRASPQLNGQVARGSVAIFLGSILLAEINLRIEVSSEGRTLDEASAWAASARPFRKIFASYSHKDELIVKQFEAFARGLGDEYLRDLTHLRSGEVWSDRLLDMIREADVFQLFWSNNSMRSAFVQQEWQYALSLGKRDFIRPVYWETPLPEDPPAGLPPDPLRRLHFQILSFTQIRMPVGVVRKVNHPPPTLPSLESAPRPMLRPDPPRTHVGTLSIRVGVLVLVLSAILAFYLWWSGTQ